MKLLLNINTSTSFGEENLGHRWQYLGEFEDVDSFFLMETVAPKNLRESHRPEMSFSADLTHRYKNIMSYCPQLQTMQMHHLKLSNPSDLY